MNLSVKVIGIERAALALELLAEGQDVVLFRELSISITNYSVEGLSLVVWSSWDYPARDSKDDITSEINKGKRSFEEIFHQWPELRNLINGCELPCFINYDYGTGSYRICELKKMEILSGYNPKAFSSE